MEQVTAIALDLARALEAIHEQDIVHRDLKPANIMLTRRGAVKLTDFGIAQVGHESQRTGLMNGHPGTPLYMSPEQSAGYDYLDGRSDLYGLGLVLYECLVGEPWGRKRRPLTLARPDTPPALVAIVDKLLQRPIEKRYEDTTALLRDLEAYTGNPAPMPLAVPEGEDVTTDAGPLSRISRDTRPLVGRVREQNLLANHLTAAIAGQGSLVLVGGEAGIGKTTLVDALRRSAAAQGALVLMGRCYDLTDTPPYGPWRELYDRLGDGDERTTLFTATTGGSTHGRELFARVRETLVAHATKRPLVIVLDNMHWADEASLDLLRAVARGIADVPLLLVVTYRTEEVAENRAFATLLPTLARESAAERVELRRFTPAEVRSLVDTRYRPSANDAERLGRHLTERSEGNPFYVEELLRTLEDDSVLAQAEGDSDRWTVGDLAGARLPSLLDHLVVRRLERLGEEDRKLLATAAIIGQEVPLDLWAAVSKADEETLVETVEAAAAARLVRETPDGSSIRFAHALIREGLYESVPPMRRRIGHRRVAETLAAQPRPDADAVAFHFRQAGDARAAEWLLRAGERAHAAFAWATAAERYAAALTLMEETGAGADERGWLIVRLAWLRRFAAPAGEVGPLETAARLAAEADDAALGAYALAMRGVVRCLAGDVNRGLSELERGVEALVALPKTAWSAVPAHVPTLREMRAALMAWLAFVGRFAEAQVLGAEVLVDWDDPSAPSDALHGFGVVNAFTGRPEEALRAFMRAKETYGATDNAWAGGFALLHELQHLVVPYQTDNPAARTMVGNAAEEVWTRVPGLRGDLPPRFARVPLLALEGAWTEARALAESADPAQHTAADPSAHAALALAQIAYDQGDTDRAWEAIRTWLPDGPRTAPGCVLYASIALVRVAAALATDAGDMQTARHWLLAHDRWLKFSGATLGRAEGQLAWGRYAAANGDAGRACGCASAALHEATNPRQPLALIAAHRMLGELDADAGDAESAAEHFGEALALAANCDAPFERARTLVALAALWEGDDPAARGFLDEARALATALGAKPLLARAQAVAATLR